MFVAADLKDANFFRSTFDTCVLMRCGLENVSLADATLTNCGVMEGDASTANLTGLSIDGGLLAMLSLDGRDFAGQTLRRVNFLKSSLVGARFDGADLTQSLFIEANLAGASMEGIRAPTSMFLGADLTRSRFKNALLDMSNWQIMFASDIRLTIILVHWSLWYTLVVHF
jgi:uncharacterized protein YjbI with pentapeptide repeats